ncbi:MAG: hypothetical protein EOP88_09525 [Verrucomicrobiaceae bacterium]|nr:MAG: hypothetical protein EOP88_09525 [Verrucomicrobiaceae bacterium]
MSIDPYSSPALNVPSVNRSQDSAITDGVVRELAGTKPWVRFLSVLMFIGTGLMVLLAIMMIVMGGAMAQAAPSNPFIAGGAGAFVGGIYLVMALLYVYPAIRLWKYASRISELMQSATSFSLEAALREQRKFWKFFGILALILVSLYALIIVGAIIMVTVGAIGARG